MVESDKVDRLNEEMARELWKHKREQVDKSMGYTIQFGHGAIKTPGIVNMAAFAAFLGFISSNADKLMNKTALIETCFIWFCVGVIASALATGGAYFAQYAYTEADNSYETSWEHPYVKEKTHWAKWLSIALHTATVALVVISYLSLMVGAWNFLDLTKAIIAKT